MGRTCVQETLEPVGEPDDRRILDDPHADCKLGPEITYFEQEGLAPHKGNEPGGNCLKDVGRGPHHQVGAVLGEFPAIAIDELSWQAQSAAADGNSPNAPSRGEAMPVSVPATSGVVANLHGEISPFDGDLRDAFALIDRLAARLEQQTAFDSVVAVEYPVDARPESALSGAIAYEDAGFRPQFRLQLAMRVPGGEKQRGSW